MNLNFKLPYSKSGTLGWLWLLILITFYNPNLFGQQTGGTITVKPDDTFSSSSVTGNTTTSGYSTTYVLVCGGNVEASNSTPNFTAPSTAQTCTMYAVNHDSSWSPAGVGSPWNAPTTECAEYISRLVQVQNCLSVCAGSFFDVPDITGATLTGTYRLDYVLVCGATVTVNAATVDGGTGSTSFTAPSSAQTCTLYAVNYDNSAGTPTYSGDLTVSNNTCYSVIDRCVTVNALPVITTPPAATAVCEGEDASFSVAATGAATLSYQWQSSTDGGATFADIAGETAATLSLTSVAVAVDGTQYQVIVTSSNGTTATADDCSVTSAAATLTVNALPAIATPPAATAVCEGEDASFSVVATGAATLSYQWQSSTDGGATFADISGETASTLSLATVAVAADGTQYQVIVTSSNGTTATADDCSVTSAAATLTVNALPAIATPPAATAVCEGEDASFSVAATGAATLSYQWQSSTDGGATFADISGETASTLSLATVAVAADGTQYQVIVTSSNGTTATADDCSVTSVAATLTVNALPDLIVAPISNSCPTATANLTTAITSSTTGLTVSYSSATPTTVGAGTYTVTVTNPTTTCSTSATVTVTINSCACTPATICEGDAFGVQTVEQVNNTDGYSVALVLVCDNDVVSITDAADSGTPDAVTGTSSEDVAALAPAPPATCSIWAVNYQGTGLATTDITVAAGNQITVNNFVCEEKIEKCYTITPKADKPTVANAQVCLNGSVTITPTPINIPNTVYISAILGNQGTTDANEDGTVNFCDEYVEISACTATDLSGFTLTDNASTRHTFPAGSIVPANGKLVIFNGNAPASTATIIYQNMSTAPSCGTDVWNNSGGDIATILDGTTTVATASYAGAPLIGTPNVFAQPTTTPATFTFYSDAALTTAVATDVADFTVDNTTTPNTTTVGPIDLWVVVSNACCDGDTAKLTVTVEGCCPAVAAVNGNATICSGDLATEITAWQAAVVADTDNAAAIADANTSGTVAYSSVLVDGTTVTAPDNQVADGIHSNPSTCAPEPQMVYAYLECYGADGADGGGDDSYLLLGTYTLTVQPDTQTPATPTPSGCTVTLVPECGNDVMAVAAIPNITGDAAAANFDAATGVYTAQPGDATGSIDITITNEFDCTPITYTLSTPACPVDCPTVAAVNGDATICSGDLATEITAWQDAVVADNAAAIADANTSGTVAYSSALVDGTTVTAPDNQVADGIHSGTDNCASEDQPTYAYLLCYGADGAVGGGDDSYLLLGTYTLTVQPDTQTPATPTPSGCTVTLVPECGNDVMAVAAIPNITGDAAAANFDAATGVYTAQPGDATGSIDITITNEFDCTPITYTLSTPACPVDCPTVAAVNGDATICSGDLATEITAWQDAVVADNAAAIADANTSGTVAYSSALVDGTTVTAPDNQVADGIHSNPSTCAPEPQMVYAYLECYGADGAVGGGDDSYLLLGTYTLTVQPPVEAPTINTSACNVTVTPACSAQTFGAATNLTGGASAANWDAATGTYTAMQGDVAGSFDVVITGVGGCTRTVTVATPACNCTATYEVCDGSTLPLLTATVTNAAATANIAIGSVNTTSPYQVDFVLVCGDNVVETISNATIGDVDATAGTASATLTHTFAAGESCLLYAVNYDSSTGTPAYDATTGNNLVQTNAAVVCLEKVSACIQINALPTANIAANAITNVSCNGGSDGAIDLTATGAATLTYEWDNDNVPPTDATADLEDLAGLMAGTYNVTVTDGNGCSATTVGTVTQPTTALSVAVDAQNDPTCSPAGVVQSDGDISITASGGTSPYTYDWSNDGAETPDNDTDDLTGLTATTAGTTYTVTITDNNGCSTTTNVTLTAPTCIGLGTIGNYVWVDLNNDGIQNDGVATGVNGVTVNLLDASGNPVLDGSGNPITTVTANDVNGNPGYYQFTNLPAGDYIVEFVLPTGASFTATQNTGTISSSTNTSNTDSNIADIATGQTGIITLGGGETINTVDAGLLPASLGNYVWYDNNGNGLQDEPLATAGIDGVTVNLLDSNGNTIATTTTATNGGNPGYYSFNVIPGTYTVQIILPSGAVITYVQDTTPIDNTNDTTGDNDTDSNIASSTATTATSVEATVVFGDALIGVDFGIIPACTANVSDIPDNTICEGDTDANNALVFSLEAYNAIYGPAPTPADAYALAYILTDNAGTIIEFQDMGAPYNTASNTPSFTYSDLADGTYRMYEIIYRVADGPLTGTAVDDNVNSIGLTQTSTCLDATYGNIYINPAPPATANNTGPICAGDDVLLIANGGVAYAWEHGSTSSIDTETPTANTTYTVTVTSSNGCSATATTTVALSPSYTATIGGGGSNTCGATAAPVTVTINSANGPWTVLYQDANGNGFTKIVADLATAPATADLTSALGTYTLVSVTSTAPGGCSATVSGSATINNSLVPPTATAAPTAVLCNGDATGAVTLTVNGASGTQTYLWSNSETSQDLTDVVAGTYTVTVTDGTCTTTTSATITQPATALSASATPTATTCNLANGTITASANGGTAGYTYSIDGTNFGASNVFSSLASGNYTVTVKDANSCTATTPIVVGASAACGSIGDLVWADTNGDGIYDPLTESGIPNVTVTLTYPNGTTITTTTDSNGNYLFDNLPAGNYTVTVGSGPAGTSLSTPGSYTHNLLAGENYLTADFGFTIPVVNCTAGTATAPAVVCSAASGLSTINLASLLTGEDAGGTWTNDANGNTVGATLDPNGVAAGVYTFTYTVVNGTCTDSETVTVRINQTPTFTVATNCTGANGTVTVTTTTTGTYEYSFNGGAFTTSAVSGPYAAGSNVNIVVRDVNTLCSASLLGYPVNCTCPTYNPTVTATLNGNPVTLGTLAQGICSSDDVVFTVTDPDIQGNEQVLSYSWSGGATGSGPSLSLPNINNDLTLILTITYTNGCTVVKQASIKVNPLPLANVATSCTGANTTISVTTNGNNTVTVQNAGNTVGTITLTGPDGLGNFAGSLSSGLLPNTTYTVVVVTPGTTCSASYNITTGPACCPGNPTLANSGPVCAGSPVTLTATLPVGATATSYAWSGPAGNATTTNGSVTIPNMTPAKAGVYNVTVTYSNGCTGVASTNVVVNPKPTITSATASCVNGSGRITVVATNAVTYSIPSSSNSTGIFNGLSAGTYTVTVTSAAGCTKTATVTVGNCACPTPVASNNGPVCAGSALSLSVNPNLPAGVTATYAWSGPAGLSTQQNPTIPNMTPAKAGTYCVTVTYSNGCTGVACTTAVLSPAPVVTISGPASFCAGSSATLIANGGDTYVWSNGVTTASTNVTTAGTYTVTVTSAAGCTKTATKTVTVNALPAIAANVNCTTNGATVTISGSATSYTLNGVTQSSNVFTGVANGTYTVSATNAAGCVGTTNVTVNCNTCAAEVGLVTVNNVVCPGDPFIAGAIFNSPAVGYANYILVANAAGVIVEVAPATSGVTQTLSTSTAGTYNVYAYSVQVPNGGTIPSVGTNVSAISGNCFDLTNPPYEVVLPVLLVGYQNSDEGFEGGITPFHYNTDTILIIGGIAPYNFDWEIIGYVRYDITYTATGAEIVIYYSDDAQWNATVTDSYSCASDSLHFTNMQGSVGNTILDIDAYVVTPSSDYTSPDGTITLTVSGGNTSCGTYTYEWSGPDTWTPSFPTTGTAPATGGNQYVLTGLPMGWYSVTVTDCIGNITEGWYWVQSGHRGRTKVDAGIMMSIQPNPFSEVTSVQFGTATSGNATVVAYTVDGKQIATLYNGEVKAGQTYQVPFTGSSLPSGMYLIQIVTNNGEIRTEKVMIAR